MEKSQGKDYLLGLDFLPFVFNREKMKFPHMSKVTKPQHAAKATFIFEASALRPPSLTVLCRYF